MTILAYDYPLLSAMITVLWIAVLIGWLVTLINVIADIVASDDLGGISKAIWVIVILLVPLLGVLVYLIARGDRMAQRAADAARESDAAARAYIREAAGTTTASSTADEIVKLTQLRDSGDLSEAEFTTAKPRLLDA